MKKPNLLLGVIVLCVLATGCAAGMNGYVGTASSQGIVAGFWRGWWHGAIAPITFVWSLFSPSVQMYEVHNNGAWYNFGFLLGILSIYRGGASGSHATRSWRKR